MAEFKEIPELSSAAPENVKNIICLDQIASHLKNNDPNKTVLLQGPDGKTRLFVNNDSNFLTNHYSDGRSFEDFGNEDAKSINFQLQFRLHKDSVHTFAHPGETLSPAIPAISYHNHVWWYWTYELGIKQGENEEMKAIFSLKSIGPQLNPNRELPRGALGENIPRTQMAPKIMNPKLKLKEKCYNLKTVLGAPDNSYVLEDFMSLEELKGLFTDEDPFLTFYVNFEIGTNYFNVENQAGLNEEETSLVKAPTKSVEEMLSKLLKGERCLGTDFVLTFGDSSKNDSVEYFVHRSAIATSSPILANFIRNRVNPPGDVILIPTAEDRIIFPHLKPEDAKFLLTFFYTQRIILPHFGSYARIGRVFCMMVERPQVLNLFKQWQKLIVQNLLQLEKEGKSERIVKESVKALIGIYSAPYGALPVAKRVAVSLLANEMSKKEGKLNQDLIEEIRQDDDFSTYNLEKFLSGIIRLRLLIASTNKTCCEN